MSPPRVPGGVPRPDPDSKPGREKDLAAYLDSAMGKHTLPWKEPGVRADVNKITNVRLSEPLYLKLHWLRHHTDRTIVELVHEGMTEFVDRELRKRGIEP